MFAEIFRFECRVQGKSPLFAVVALVFLLLAYLAMAAENVTIGGGTQNLDLNAPFTIIQSQLILSIVAMFGCAAFIAVPLTRDAEFDTAATFVATGVPRLPFLFGRVAGGALFACLAACASILGTWLGTLMPWLDQQRIGAFTLAPYWFSVWAVTVPNVLIIGALVAAVAALTRSLLASYTVLLAVLIADVVVQAATDVETLSRMALFDPFGVAAFADVTRYWTVFDKNTLIPAMSGTLLWNRLLWLAVAAAVFAAAAWRFRLETVSGRGRRRAGEDAGAVPLPNVVAARLAPTFGGALTLKQVASQIGIDLRGVLKSYPFYVLLAFGMVNVLAGFFGAISELYGTPVLPVTRMMLSVVDGSYSFIVFFIVVYYAGELMHRERQLKVAEIVDASPYPNGVMVVAKTLTLWFVIVALLGVVMLTAMAVQIGHGYYRFEVERYLVGLFVVQGWPMYLLAVLAIAIQAIVSNKFLGMLLLVVLFLGVGAMNALGFEHVLYQFGVPAGPLSDMNGWGHFVEPMVTVGGYWSLWMVLAGVVAHLFMRRGAVEGVRARLAVARLRLTRPVVATSIVTAVAIAVLGSWIFYNTNVLNHYETARDTERLQAQYEQRYRQYKDLPKPEVVDVDADVDIYPTERRIESRGSALAENATGQPITEIHLTLARPLHVNALEVGASRLVESDPLLGYYRYALDRPLEPAATLSIRWDLSWRNPGFVNGHSSTRVVGNGTFVNNTEIMPMLGYDTGRELIDNNKRRKYGLPPAERLPKYGKVAEDAANQFGVHRRTNFHTVVSTSAEQTAIAPGYLVRDWVDGGRHFFEYAMDAPIWPFFSYQSARYAVARDRWHDVELAVYYHPPHHYNVQRMLDAAKASLDYFTREFSPYPYRQFRIIEFPAYERFAQSFPNTVPFSEGIGFIADLSDPKRIDYVFYVTAHELAHQWWGHQLVGRHQQGETLLVETLAQYSALMVMKHAYGAAKMRRFLKYELDNYLSKRGSELIEELPLKLVEDQGYVHYNKGSLAMYALQDAIGEAAVNRALRRMLARWASDESRFPSSGDLIDAFRAEAPPDAQALITALFEKIVLWDLAVTDASVTATADGRYKVRMTVTTRQFLADGAGRETEVPLDVPVDVGVFPVAGKDLGPNDLPPPLLLEKRRFDGSRTVLEFVVDKRPARVGIDPYNKLIDRNPDDNLRAVE